MINKKEFGDWAVVFWKKGSKTLHIAQNQGDLGTTNYWMVGTTTRQFDYESGWLPNKEWTSTIKGHFSKDKAIQLAKEKAGKALNESTHLLTESEDAMKLYKGIVKGRQRQLKTEGTGMWFSSSKDVAKTYSEEVETWELDTSLPLRAARIDCHQKSWNEVNTDAYARKYKDYDVIIFKDIVDVGPLVLKYTKKNDKRTTKEAFKDFTADTIVVNNPSCLKKVQTEILKESTETLKHFDKLYHGSQYGELRSDEKHKYNCLYVTPVFAYAALYSTGSDSEHGCVFEMQPVRDLNIFDANDEGALEQLKAKVEKLNPENTLVKSIKWEDLKTKDWSTVCFRKDQIRDDLLLKAVKELGYDGYINHEWDADCAQFYAEGLAGCGKVTNTISIGIFDENLLEITDEKYFDDYSDDDLFNECHQADEDFFIAFLQDGGYNDFYYDTAEEAAKFAAENLLFLDVDEVNDLIEEYANLESDD